MLIILPPSETKAPGGDGPPVDLDELAFPALTPVRARLIAALEALAAHPDAARRALGLSVAQSAELVRNAELRAAPTRPALERYTGVLYDALDARGLDAASRRRADERLAVCSALFGLVRADDSLQGR